jgi:hypothetical protein
MTRPQAHAKLKAIGAFPHGSISNSVDYLITGENVGPKKMKDAAAKGVVVLPYSKVAGLLEAESELAEAELRRLYRTVAELSEATSSSDVVRLRARRTHLLNGLGLEERDFNQAMRDKAASSGSAMDDGSFPIENTGDLKNAIRAVGRAKPSKRPAVRAHIRKRAKALGAALPEGW